MKKYVKIIFSTVLALTILMSALVFNASAASMSASGGSYEIGQKVNISVAYEGDAALVSVLVEASYDTKVLRFDSVSGVKAEDVNASGSSIKFIDENFSNGSKRGSYRLSFTAIAEGSTNVNISATGSDGEKEFPASKVAAVTVTTPKPSSNANLASIRLSAGSLSPAFDANTTNYNVTVKYGVESIDITGAVADGKSAYTGGGTFDLNVGDNERILTVTAQDGTKKTYIINVKRMTEAETLDAEEDERNSNPLLVTIDGADYTIVNEIEDTMIPTGFTKATATRKESEITVLNDVNGKYQLCYLVDNNGENGAFYRRDENDNFTKLTYINVDKIMYIIEEFEIDGILPTGYKYTKFAIDGTDTEAIGYADEALADFYIFNCFVPGQESATYYKYDKIEGTMQRAADFGVALQNVESTPTDTAQTQGSGIINWFKSLNATGKAVLLLTVFIGIVLIVAAILLIVKITATPDQEYNDVNYGVDENDEFILSDISSEKEITENKE